MKKLFIGIFIFTFALAAIALNPFYPVTYSQIQYYLNQAKNPIAWASPPTISVTDNANNYSQITCQNLSTGTSASCDFIAYSGTVTTDANGYSDMGFNNHLFNQSIYNVAAADEGYFFVSAPGQGTGNMVLATDSTGTSNGIQLCVNGLASKSSCLVELFGTGRFGVGSVTDNGNDTLQITGNYSYTQAEKDLSLVVTAPTTGNTVTLATGTETQILNPAGSLLALTVTLPACTSTYNGSIARFNSTQLITTLTVNATSGSVKDAPTSISAVGAGYGYICQGSSTTWFRLY